MCDIYRCKARRGLVDEFDGKDCFYLICHQENAYLYVPYKPEYKVTIFPIGILEEKTQKI
jgi:hypothetical protein